MTAITLPEIRKIPFLVAWGTWPILSVGSTGGLYLAVKNGGSIATAAGIATSISALCLLAIETLWPAEAQWKMTWRTFLHRDLKYFIAGGAAIAATNLFFTGVGIKLAEGTTGWGNSLPLYVAVPLGIFCVDFLQYWHHRISHESQSHIGKFLWRTHVAHHLPEQVYLLMHPASHPINAFIVRGLATILPLYFLGLSPLAVALVNMVIGMQSLISHANADFRAGLFNYIFVGAELHRFHHSAAEEDAGNYATALALLDVMFGTHVYRKNKLPLRLGVHAPEAYPRSEQIFKVLALPFFKAN